MSEIRRNPAADRKVTHLLANIGFETKEERERAYFAALEPLVGVQRAILAYKEQLADGLRLRDPVALLASVQKLQDELCEFLAAGDEQGKKFLEQRDKTIVTRAANVMTKGEYRIETHTGNWTADSMVARSLRDTLRQTNAECEATRIAEKEAAAGAVVEAAAAPKP